ncbi:DUF2182 domain-containing protein [Mesorhizobium sp. M8A.F.Ca.ET.173.01.1.1]|nr:DUF2182 domain-containing protein [Mesorhizobium sp. M8A.F.Ca.ET.173.01.1.1]
MRTGLAIRQVKIQSGTPLLLGLILLGWIYSIAQVLTMDAAGSVAQAGPGMQFVAAVKAALTRDPLAFESLSLCVTGEPQWALIDFGKAFAMWMGMVLAMMLPALLPMLKGGQTLPQRSSFLEFLVGYVVSWIPFCAIAVVCQYLLRQAGFLDEFMVSDSAALTLGIFGFVALFYSARLETRRFADDRRIRSRPRPMNSFRDGLAHGLSTFRRCWPLMTVMFAVGLMNIIAMALLTALMADPSRFMAARLRDSNRSAGSGRGNGLLALAAYASIRHDADNEVAHEPQ